MCFAFHRCISACILHSTNVFLFLSVCVLHIPQVCFDAHFMSHKCILHITSECFSFHMCFSFQCVLHILRVQYVSLFTIVCFIVCKCSHFLASNRVFFIPSSLRILLFYLFVIMYCMYSTIRSVHQRTSTSVSTDTSFTTIFRFPQTHDSLSTQSSCFHRHMFDYPHNLHVSTDICYTIHTTFLFPQIHVSLSTQSSCFHRHMFHYPHNLHVSTSTCVTIHTIFMFPQAHVSLSTQSSCFHRHMLHYPHNLHVSTDTYVTIHTIFMFPQTNVSLSTQSSCFHTIYVLPSVN